MGASCAKELIRVKILPDKDRSFQIGVGMKDKDKVETLLSLVQNVDVFIWSLYEVPRLDPEFMVHALLWIHYFLPRSKIQEGRLKSILRQSSKKLRD